jgi:hypothetical protein
MLLVLPFTAAAQNAQWQRPSEAEVESFAEDFLLAMHSQKIERINELIDWDAILNRAMRDAKAPKAIAAFRQGFMREINGGTGMPAELVRATQAGGSYIAINARRDKSFGHALFRLILPDGGGFNYHDFAVVKQPDGKVRAVDLYIFLSGESVADTIRRAFLPTAASEDPTLAAKLSEGDKLAIKHAADIKEITAASQAGDYVAVLKYFDALPETLQKEKNLLIIRLVAAQKVGREELAAAIKDFARFHPKDGCMNMLSIDAFVLQEEYDQALVAIDNLQKLIGNDGYLTIVKSRIYETQGDDKTAKKLVQQAIEQDDMLLEGYWSLIGFAIKERDHAQLLKLLKTVDSKFEIEFNDLTTVPQYQEFVKSDYFKQWQDYLAAKPQRAIQNKKTEP